MTLSIWLVSYQTFRYLCVRPRVLRGEQLFSASSINFSNCNCFRNFFLLFFENVAKAISLLNNRKRGWREEANKRGKNRVRFDDQKMANKGKEGLNRLDRVISKIVRVRTHQERKEREREQKRDRERRRRRRREILISWKYLIGEKGKIHEHTLVAYDVHLALDGNGRIQETIAEDGTCCAIETFCQTKNDFSIKIFRFV